jgi:uncharacterized membrane protein
MNTKPKITTAFIVKTGVMAAVVCVITFLRVPLLGSKVHFANAFCLISGLLLGPVSGGLAAGLGSALYDILFGGYDIVQALITFVSKFLMAFLCAKIAYSASANAEGKIRNIVASISGALFYVLLYMLKTYIYQRFVYGYPLDAVWATMLAKLPASLINAVAAMIVAPLLFMLINPAVKKLENRA